LIAFFIASPYGNGRKTILEKEIPMEVALISGNGYKKILFTKLNLPQDGQVSLFFWEDGESIPHDHSVDELTYVAAGTIKEVRKLGEEYIVKFYTEGDLFEVPKGTKHVVKAVGNAVTLNVCMGDLAMNAVENFLPIATVA
jgi:quercetin dioxygenase-like cupin family protein